MHVNTVFVFMLVYVFVLGSRWRLCRPMVPACSIRSCGVSRTWRRTGRQSAWLTSLSLLFRGRPRLCPTRCRFRRWMITVLDPNPALWLDTPERTVSDAFSSAFIRLSSGTLLIPECTCAVPSAAPGDVRVLVLNSTLAEVRWSPVSPESVRGRLQGYKVQISSRHVTCRYSNSDTHD